MRAGAIIPMGPIVQYATERPEAPYDVRVYAGADGRFTLYEDDNETYAYEKGQAARYDLDWNAATRTLKLGPRRGTFPGVVKRRTLNIILVETGERGGVWPRAGRTIDYDGRSTSVRFSRTDR